MDALFAGVEHDIEELKKKEIGMQFAAKQMQSHLKALLISLKRSLQSNPKNLL